ncbi:MAG: 3D domain-containing protein, partial [Bacillota bacterium]|nr:3D domain-containing protein [Bacillota bacterium]
VIPLGSKLYVEGYGVCTAEDTGGLIKGNRIDVFLNTEEECDAWGVKSVKVYILK